MKIRKITVQIISIILPVLLLTSGCSQKKELPEEEKEILLEKEQDIECSTGYHTDYCIEYLSVEEAIRQSTDIIVATYVQEYHSDFYVEKEFEVKQVIKGETEASTIYVTESVSDVTFGGAYSYELGEDYVLVLERNKSVYYEHDHYVLLGDIFIPLSDIKAAMAYHTDISEHMELVLDETAIIEKTKTETELETELETKLLQYIDLILSFGEQQTKAFYGTLYEESEELCDIVPASTHILQVKIERPLAEGIDRENYYCSVEKCLKGDTVIKDTSGEILIPFFKGQVEPGESYVVLLDKIDETSWIYVHSSRNSVFLVEDAEAISEIEEILKLEN